MGLKSDYQDELDKTLKLCHENDLEFEFMCSKFPVTAFIRPNPEKLRQMQFKGMGEDKPSIDGKVYFIF